MILQVIPFHKMYTFGAKNRPSAAMFAADDVTCDIYAKWVRDARVGLVPKIFGKARESIFSTYVFQAVQHIKLQVTYICSNLQIVFASP